jgi:hypothetical protein
MSGCNKTALLMEVSEMNDWKKIRKENYGKDTVVNYGKGYIDFSPEGMKKVKHGEALSYEDYLEIQKKSCEQFREYFAMCYWNHYVCDFKGQIERINESKGKVVFKRLFVDGMYHDGIGFFGKEDHVWMDKEPFAEYSVGDCLRFSANICRYLKTGNGKYIDYDLENPEAIKKIDSYEVPTDQELVDQQIEQLVCETCRYYDQCYMGMCISNEDERKERIETLKSLEPGKFTPITVMLAYELEYRMMLQNGGIRLDKKDPKYDVMKRFVKICETHPVYYIGDVNEALFMLMYPEKPRMYIED